MGGLFEIFRMFGLLLVAPCASYKRKSELLTKIFRFIPSFNNSKKSEESKIGKLEDSTETGEKLDQSVLANKRLEEHINWDFSQPKLI